MRERIVSTLVVSILFVLGCAHATAGVAEELERLYRIDRLPELDPGSRVAEISSYDRTGGNDDGFSGKYSAIGEENGKLVIADLKGPGVIERIWTPTPTEELLEFYFDHETEPRIRIPFIDLFTGKQFPFVTPIVGHEVGGYYCYLPIPYRLSCKILYAGKRIQFHQIQYRTLAGETTESFPREWSESERAELDRAVKFWSRVGENIVADLVPPGNRVEVETKKVVLRPGEPQQFFRTPRGGRIVGLELTPASALAGDFKDIIFEARWDREFAPAINCPASDFFGFAFGKPSARSLLLGTDGGRAYCYLPMPFNHAAVLSLTYRPVNPRRDAEPPEVEMKTYIIRGLRQTPKEGKLYAIWRREQPAEGQPYLLLDARGRGHMAGVMLQARGLNPGMTLFFEGDDVATIDGEMRMHGTGSEDFFNGGWYALADRWDGARSLPMSGCLDYSIPMARTGGYRFFIGDKVSFDRTFNLTIEHGPEGNKVPVDYNSLAFYYSDVAPTANNPPTPEQRTITHATQLEYWLQLLPILAVSNGAAIKYGNTKDEESGKSYETLTLTPQGNSGFVKVRLDVPVAGDYGLAVSYFAGPAAARFRAYQRQEPIGDAIDAYAEKTKIVERAPIGTLRLPAGENSVTFRIEGRNESAKGSGFTLHRIYLLRSQER